MLDYEGSLLCVKDETVGITLACNPHEKGSDVPLNDLAGDDTLFGIQETGIDS